MTSAAAPTKGVLATSVRGIDELARSLEARGWHVGLVSGGPSKAEALDAVGRALNFPDYYGRNLDALADCLSDLGQPTALVWAGWEPLAVHSPDDWSRLVAVLKRRVDAAGAAPFSVVFSVATPDGAAA